MSSQVAFQLPSSDAGKSDVSSNNSDDSLNGRPGRGDKRKTSGQLASLSEDADGPQLGQTTESTGSINKGFGKRSSRRITPSYFPSLDELSISANDEKTRMSMPMIAGVNSTAGSLSRPSTQKVAGTSVPDVSRVDFVLVGPGIGTSTSSASDTAGSRRESQYMGSGGTQPQQSRSANSSRRPTFQGKSALMISTQKRMSAVDVSQLGISTERKNSRDSVRSSMGSIPANDKPTILLYPKKEVMISSQSMGNVRDSSRHGSVVSLRRPTASRSGSISASRTGSVQIGDSKDGKAGRAGSVGYLAGGDGSATIVRAGFSSRTGMAGSVSMGALAAAGSARLSQAKREAQETSDRGSRHSVCFVPSTFGSAPAGVSAIDSKRSSLRPPSDAQLEEMDDEDMDVAPPEMSRLSTPTTPAFDSRPMSVVGHMDETYRTNPEYYEYLMLSQRHSSSNFIHKIDSSEVVWKSEGARTKMIGRYLLGDQIGKGSFGKVKEGLCSETLQRVAVKIINKKRLRKMQGGVETAIREIKLLRRMKHRNTIRLIDVYCKVEDDNGEAGVFNWFSAIEEEPITWRFEDGTEEDRHVQILKWYLIFEYCPCSLQTLLEQEENNKLPLSRAHWFFVQLIEGISYLHSQNVIHRDIKAGNMLITADNTLKISDFGIAEQFSTYSDAPMDITSFAGTHQFLSPEVAEGVAQCSGEPVDVWACGVTLYNMLTGRYPFEFDEDGNLLVLYEKIMAGTFEMPAHFDEDLQQLLRGMLEKDPASRLTTSQILQHPWTRTHFKDVVQPPVLLYPVADSPTTPSPTKSIPSPTKSPTTPTSATRSPAEGKIAIHTHKHITPCETTLLPFLDGLYAQEVEADLEKSGKLEDLAGHSQELTQGTALKTPHKTLAQAHFPTIKVKTLPRL
ncbi:hypothetical protein PhCBS80983_g03804 [Powellomyces hirtus]|uniref:non-specific serine/threonine protein kinase n=1 Tax=Powellomyces hirtus TaxID=109895 RepID=A0A507E152_9FUNG|nr:hypothetical protein PhCBS80983_g03804 [Powellomyces hirtus]